MTDIPIIFSAPMVRALLDGRKTMTRRLAWQTMFYRRNGALEIRCKQPAATHSIHSPSPWQRVRPGDRLWVREKIHVRPIASAMHAYSYADEEDPNIIGGWKKVRLLPYDHMVERPERPVWRPSIHMPREFSRFTLIVTATKIERLQDISEEGALAEGVVFDAHLPSSIHRHSVEIDDGELITGWDARETFSGLWQHINGIGSWDANPEVVALTFTVHRCNIDHMNADAA